MASFADFLAAADREEVVLVELEPSITVGDFDATPATANTYEIAFPTIPAGEVITGGVYRAVIGVRENATDLTQQSSIATVDANPGSWWHDPATDTLYVHSTTGSDPDTFTAYQVFVRLHVSTAGRVLELTPGDGDTGVYYHPWVIGRMPELTERDDEASFGVKTTQGGPLTLLNGHRWWNRVVAPNGDWNWKNAVVRILVGGSYNAGAHTLTRAQYQEVITLLVEDATATHELAEFELKPLNRRLDSKLPRTPYFAASYPNLGDGVQGSKKWIGYGRTIMRPDLTDTSSHGVYTVADAAFQTLFAITAVWAIDRSTGAWTLLTLTSDYTVDLTACTIIVVNATYTHTAYTLAADVTGKPDGAGSYLQTFGAIVRDILETHVGVPTADIDTASFAQADLDAPEELAVWLKSPRSVASILATAQDGFPSLERSVMGHISQSKAGKWTANIWDPDYVASAIGSLRQDEFAAFRPIPTLRRLYGEVNIHYNRDHARDEWAVASATDSRVKFLKKTEDVLDIWTYLRDAAQATTLAQRRLVMSGGQSLAVEFRERGIRLCTSRVRDRYFVSHDPAPNADGAFVAAPMEITRLDIALAPQLQVSGRLENLRGTGEFIGRWTDASAPAWSAATPSDKLVSGFWANDAGRVDPADPATENISRWY